MRVDVSQYRALARRVEEPEFVEKSADHFVLLYARSSSEGAGFDTLVEDPSAAADDVPAMLRSIHPLTKQRLSADLGTLTVGRAPGCDIVIRSDNISKLHARFRRDDAGHWQLQDLKSRNGTFVNGARLPSLDSSTLSDGDHLQFGSVEARLVSARRLWRLLRG